MAHEGDRRTPYPERKRRPVAPSAMNDRAIAILGWVATCTGIIMYLSYIDQIQLNLAGQKGSTIQPLATMVNCTLWVGYGALKDRRDWPIVVANFPGVVLGAIALATAL